MSLPSEVLDDLLPQLCDCLFGPEGQVIYMKVGMEFPQKKQVRPESVILGNG